VGRYILQDFLGHVWKPLGDTRSLRANLVASGLMVGGWGYFLIQGVRDPLGGINSLWPLFGIANQMLAAIALCLATTIILKMQLHPEGGTPRRPEIPGSMESQGLAELASPKGTGKPALALITLIPLIWLVAVTFTAGVEKIWSPDPRIGFLAQAHTLKAKINMVEGPLEVLLPPKEFIKWQHDREIAKAELPQNHAQYFNNLLDATVAGIFLALVVAIVLLSLREWFLLLSRRKPAVLHETEPVWLPDYALAEGRPLHIAGTAALALALVKEWSGESHLERAHRQAQAVCECHPATAQQIYVKATEQRFNGVRRCC
jgi:carbon starvation protein